MRSSPRRPWRVALSSAVVGALLLAALLLPAAADPIINVDEFPKVAFVARNDVPFDSLSVGPIAGALGGIVVITSSTNLSDAARDALIAFDPDLVVIAGGTAAISAGVEAQIAAAGGWDVERKSGPTRDQTAAALATLLDDLGVGRPALSGDRQIVGDVTVGGMMHVDDLTVQSQMVFTDRLAANVSLTGATSNATAAEILKIESLPPGEYVITGHALGSSSATDRSRVICRILLDGAEVAQTINRVGTLGGESSQLTFPLVGHIDFANPLDLVVRCHAENLTGGAPNIAGHATSNRTHIVVTRIP